MAILKTTPDLAVRKTTGSFSATFTTSTGTVTIDFGDGGVEESNTPSNTYTADPPYLINTTSEPSNITGIDLSSQSLTAFDLSRYFNIDDVDVSGNSLRVKDIGKILLSLDDFGLENGSIDISSNSQELGLTPEEDAAKESLIAKGWTITGLATDWTPSSMTTAAWFDAADYSTITEAGNVSQWNDKSGNTRHAVEATATEQPAYNSADPLMNELPSIGNNNDGLRRYLTPTGAFTARNIYFIGYYNDTSFFSWMVPVGSVDNTPRTSGQSGQNYWAADATTTYIHKDGDGSTNYLGASSLPILPMTPTLWEVEWNADYNETWRMFSAGSSWQKWTEGGALSEVIFTDGTETTDTRQKLEGYLAHKWGTTESLPIDHPYKTRKPIV